MRSLKILFILVASVIFILTSLPIEASGESPVYAARGPYNVGRAWFRIGKGDSGLILVALYPAAKPTGGGKRSALVIPNEYRLSNESMLDGMANVGASSLNAAPDPSGGPYPLVIFSPYYSGSASDYADVESHLASYGFVVFGLGINRDMSVWQHYVARPQATIREINLAESLSSQDTGFGGLIDTRHIGVVGHSSGGYTALAAAGARFNFAWFKQWCANHPDDVALDVGHDCPGVLAHVPEMLTLARLETMPAGLWPSWGDPRVTAIVSQSGDASVFGPEGLAPITIPVMVQVGSQDMTNVPEWNSFLTYDHVSSLQKSEVIFAGQGHTFFISNPSDWGASNAAVQELIRHFTTAFLLDTLKGDKQAHRALLPANVNLEAIQYKTTLK